MPLRVDKPASQCVYTAYTSNYGGVVEKRYVTEGIDATNLTIQLRRLRVLVQHLCPADVRSESVMSGTLPVSSSHFRQDGQERRKKGTAFRLSVPPLIFRSSVHALFKSRTLETRALKSLRLDFHPALWHTVGVPCLADRLFSEPCFPRREGISEASRAEPGKSGDSLVQR